MNRAELDTKFWYWEGVPKLLQVNVRACVGWLNELARCISLYITGFKDCFHVHGLRLVVALFI